MYAIEQLKRSAEKLTGLARPGARKAREAVRARKPVALAFRDDGRVPNNPTLRLVLYRTPVRLSGSSDPAAVFEDLFAANGWGDSWRNGIYDYTHYHSRIHEVLGIARGRALVEFGGTAGRKIEVKAGDVAILPAGTGHKCLRASRDFLVVGAYPTSGTYDECRPSKADHDGAVSSIRRVALPRKDPVYGRDGPLKELWRSRRG